MKKILVLLTFLILIAAPVYAQKEIIKPEISAEEIPDTLFGSWRVIAKLDSTNSYSIFKPQSAYIWNIYKSGNAITLQNYYTGVKANISIKVVEGSLIVFSKINPYDNKIYTDTITIRLDGDRFTGINTAVLESFSLIDNHLMKTEIARYHIKGERINSL